MIKFDNTADRNVRKQYERSERAKKAWASRKVREEFMRNTWRLEDLDVGDDFWVGLYSTTLVAALNALIKHRVKQHPNEVYEIDITKSMNVTVWRVA